MSVDVCEWRVCVSAGAGRVRERERGGERELLVERRHLPEMQQVTNPSSERDNRLRALRAREREAYAGVEGGRVGDACV